MVLNQQGTIENKGAIIKAEVRKKLQMGFDVRRRKQKETMDAEVKLRS